MCEEKPKVTLSELILAAICHLQEKNGVTACEIAEFIANKRGCELSKIQSMIKMILCKAQSEGILCENKGFYRIKNEFDDPPPQKCKEKTVSLCDEDSDDDDEDDGCDDESVDPCECLQLSRECLSETDENRCGEEEKCPKKKRKCK